MDKSTDLLTANAAFNHVAWQKKLLYFSWWALSVLLMKYMVFLLTIELAWN